jgi:serine/threonine protein kinase
MASDPYIGRVIDDRYEILQRISAGGMATVYRARAIRLGRDVAVKVMHQHLAQDEAFVKRFETEARAIAQVNHPSIVQVFDTGVDQNAIYIAMELLDGGTLRDAMAAHGAYTVSESLDITARILDALSAAHRLGIVHRDIKPENILIGSGGQLKVADFGISRALSDTRLTQTGQTIGTVSYMAPELLSDGQVSPAIDVYAVGVVLYELLTGRRPFTGENTVQIALQKTTRPFPELGIAVPQAVDALLQQLTGPLPYRFGDANAALAATTATRAQVQTFVPAAVAAPDYAPTQQAGIGIAGAAVSAPPVKSSKKLAWLGAIPVPVIVIALLVIHPWTRVPDSVTDEPTQAGLPGTTTSATTAPPEDTEADEAEPDQSGPPQPEQSTQPESGDTSGSVDTEADELAVGADRDNYSWDGDTVKITGNPTSLAFTEGKKIPKTIEIGPEAGNPEIYFSDYVFAEDTTVTITNADKIVKVYVSQQQNTTIKWTATGAGQMQLLDELDAGEPVNANTKSGTRKTTPDKNGKRLTLVFDDISGIGIVGRQ